MADRVPKITEQEKPTFDAAVYSDRLQEINVQNTNPPRSVFDKASKSSIVPLAQYVRTKLTDTVNALSEFTAAHENRLNTHTDRLDTQNARITKLEEAGPPPVPFPGSG